jgi:seryl-tRNA synthetase
LEGLKSTGINQGADVLQADLEKEHKELLASAAEKEKLLKAKLRTIGNIVHDSVPISDNEVRQGRTFLLNIAGI